MKREIITFEKAFGVEALKMAEKTAGAGKKGLRPAVLIYRANLEDNLKDLYQRLKDGTYVPDAGRTFRMLSQSKWRVLHTVGYEARIVDQAIVNAMESRIYKGLIRRTYGCIKGRGGVTASMRVRKDMHEVNYFVKADIKKYYSTIRREILMNQLRSRFKGEKFLGIVELVLNAYENTSVEGMLNEGVSIGSRKSQLFGVLYLSDFDHAVHQIFKIKHYVRYVDDMVFGFDTKEEAVVAIPLLKQYLKETLGLELHKIRLIPADRQMVDYCMYQHIKDKTGKVYTRLRKRVMRRCFAAFRDIQKKWEQATFSSKEEELEYIKRERSRLFSYLGYLKHCNGYLVTEKLKNEHGEIFRRVNRCAKKPRGRQKTNTAAA